MSAKNRVKATAKNIEGKVQETMGDLTGDTKNQVEGREKQAEAKIRHAVEDVKDQVKEVKEVMEQIKLAGGKVNQDFMIFLINS